MFEYNMAFAPKEYFPQVPNTIYWISIQAYWDVGSDPDYPWGWKARPHFWNDDAVIGTASATGAAVIWNPIEYPQSVGWDMAFGLDVPEPATLILLATGSLAALTRCKKRPL